jgi:hypothetical protein
MNENGDATVDIQTAINELLGAIEQLKAENLKMRECLEFYASGDSWSLHEYFTSKDNDNWDLIGGQRARELLKELE